MPLLNHLRIISTLVTISISNSISNGQSNINSLTNFSIEATPKLYELYSLDVKNYYNLADRPEFSSELKIKNFKQSSEYIDLYNSLVRGRSEMFDYTYYIRDNNTSIGKYVLSCQCFPLNIKNSYTGQRELDLMHFPIKGNILFFDSGKIQRGNIVHVHDEVAVSLNPLPVVTQGDNKFLLLRVAEQQALEMEDNSNLSVYYFFNPRELKTNNHTYTLKVLVYSEKRTETHRVFVADGLRVVVADNTTGKIYYDKVYGQSGIFKVRGEPKGLPVTEGSRSNISKAFTILDTDEDKTPIVKAKLRVPGWNIGKSEIKRDQLQNQEQGHIIYDIKVDKTGMIISAIPRRSDQTISDDPEEYYRRSIMNLKLERSDIIKPLDVLVGTLKIIVGIGQEQ